jgi:preprotein translocase subunit SecA
VHLDLWLPNKLTKKTELAMKRAVVSCLDLISDVAAIGTNASMAAPGRLEVEDIVARAGDSAPTQDIAVRLLRGALTAATTEFDATIKREKETVKRLGGLYVIGTSRHESRRIDNQLRGRAGRQGDPGGTRFFLSLEDDIFKIFGADKMSGMLENFRVAEDMPIESDIVVTALDKVQIQVEDYFKATRQQVFKLDDITSSQRSAVYSQRRAFLSSSDEGMYMFIYIYVYVYTFMYLYIFIIIDTCIYFLYICIYMSVYLYIHVYSYICKNIYLCTYILYIQVCLIHSLNIVIPLWMKYMKLPCYR